MNVAEVCSRVIRIGFYLLFALVPLLLTPWNYELFEYNKMMAVYGITVIVATAWLIRTVHQKKFSIARTPLDIPIALFVLSQFVSSLLSIDPHVSWFGYYSRFNGGMWSVASYILLYYAFVTHIKNVMPLLTGALATGSVVALYGVAERLGIDKHLWVQDVQNRVFSTLGQPNWLAAYLVALSAVAMYFSRKSVVWMGVSVLFFLTLLFTRSRSGLLGFAVADVLFWGIIFARGPLAVPQGVPLRKMAVLMHVVFAFIVFFNGTNFEAIDGFVTLRGLRTRFIKTTAPAPLEATPSALTAPALESGGTESGVIRKYVWQGAINAWKSSTKTLLVGTGTETFAFAFYQYRPVEHNLTSEWDFLYNKAHNEYLNYLATTGVFGLGSYLLVIVGFLWVFAKKKRDPIEIAIGAGWVSLLITNFFGFSVVITQVLFFLLPAFVFVSAKQLHTNETKRLAIPAWAVWPVFFLGAYLLFSIARMWYADSQFAAGYRLVRAGNAGKALQHLASSVRINSREPLYHDELGSLYASIAASAFAEKDATSAAQFMRESIRESDQALTASPQNVNFWKTRTKIYVALSDIDAQFTAHAIDALNESILLSPNDPKILYNLAILHGRLGESNQSVAYLSQAITLKPNYRDAYFALSVFYTELGEPQEARNILQTYLDTVDPRDADFQERLLQ